MKFLRLLLLATCLNPGAAYAGCVEVPQHGRPIITPASVGTNPRGFHDVQFTMIHAPKVLGHTPFKTLFPDDDLVETIGYSKPLGGDATTPACARECTPDCKNCGTGEGTYRIIWMAKMDDGASYGGSDGEYYAVYDSSLDTVIWRGQVQGIKISNDGKTVWIASATPAPNFSKLIHLDRVMENSPTCR